MDFSSAAANNRDDNSPGKSSNEKALKEAMSKKSLDRKDRMNLEAIQKITSLKAQAPLDYAEGTVASKAYLDMMFNFRMMHYGNYLPMTLRIQHCGHVLGFLFG